MRRGASAPRVPAADVEPLDEAEQSALVAELARASAAQARFWRVRTALNKSCFPPPAWPRAAVAQPLDRAQGCFGLVGLALAALFAWAAVWQVVEPWQVRSFAVPYTPPARLTPLLQLVFHADFYGVLPAIAVAAADAAAAASVGAASFVLLRAASQPPKPDALPRAEPPRTVAALAVATSAFWGIAWVRLLRLRATEADAAPPSDALKLLWLPLAPLYTLLCEHVERSVQDTAATVRQRAGFEALRAKLTQATARQVATLRGMQYRYKAL